MTGTLPPMSPDEALLFLTLFAGSSVTLLFAVGWSLSTIIRWVLDGIANRRAASVGGAA